MLVKTTKIEKYANGQHSSTSWTCLDRVISIFLKTRAQPPRSICPSVIRLKKKGMLYTGGNTLEHSHHSLQTVNRKRKLALGRTIQKIRKERGLTQEQLAEKLGISLTYMGYFEIGHRIPNLKMLCKIADFLRVKVKDLIPF